MELRGHLLVPKVLYAADLHFKITCVLNPYISVYEYTLLPLKCAIWAGGKIQRFTTDFTAKFTPDGTSMDLSVATTIYGALMFLQTENSRVRTERYRIQLRSPGIAARSRSKSRMLEWVWWQGVQNCDIVWPSKCNLSLMFICNASHRLWLKPFSDTSCRHRTLWQ